MREDIDSELQRIQEIALDHAISEMDEAAARKLETKEDRGDRGFLTGMAAKSLGVAVRIEQFIALRRGRPPAVGDDAEQEQQAKSNLVNKARAEVRGILERAGVGNTPRGK